MRRIMPMASGIERIVHLLWWGMEVPEEETSKAPA